MNYLTASSINLEAEARVNELNNYCQLLKKRMAKYSKGKIHFICHKGKYQYYLRKDPKEKTGIYISKKETEKIKTLLQKRYDEEAYRLLAQQKKNLEDFLRKENEETSKLQMLYSNQPEEIKNQLHPIDLSDDDLIKEWLSLKYTGKTIGSEVPSFITDNGEHVRSKSELLIANTLLKHKMPYKYECPLTLSEMMTIYPDFTILNVKKRKVMYWEHRGMMDDRDYAKHAIQRVKHLTASGIFPGDKLILTEETVNCPLGTNEIEQVIKHYLK